MRCRVVLAVVVFVANSACSDPAATTADADPPPSADADTTGPDDGADNPMDPILALVQSWAPVFRQDTDSTDFEADYFTAIDYDGDWIGNNNWQGLDADAPDLRAWVYYTAIESESHWFLSYLVFHPRDWQEVCLFGSGLCHENDLEGAMVVVEKDGSEHGRFFALITQAHGDLNLFANDEVVPRDGASFRDSGVTFEDDSHPLVFVEAKGHGICADTYAGSLYCGHEIDGEFPGGDGIVYRAGSEAETPESGDDRDVRYRLVSFESTVWPHRGDVCGDGCLFDSPMVYGGLELGRSFDGDDYGDDKANPPWAWSDGDALLGDFFFRPATALAAWLELPESFSQSYLHNIYLP